MRLIALTDEAGSARMRHAVAGLALRGHQVAWRGTGAPPPAAGAAPPAPGAAVDLVLSDRADPSRAGWAAWMARARGVLLPMDAATVARWGARDRWFWSTLHGHGLIDPLESEAFRARSLGLDPQRIALWPDGAAAPGADVAHADTEVLERACERALAHDRAGSGLRAALFVDRDGTLIREVGYLADPDALELLPGVVEAIRSARGEGHPVIVISNQAGVGRGLYPLEQAYRTMARLRERLRESGVELDGIYFCPHRPDQGCSCRKPRPGLLLRAAEDQGLALARSVMVGDKRLDVAAGKAAGTLGVLVRTGYGRDEESALDPATGARPDAVVDGLPDAVRWWLDREATAG